MTPTVWLILVSLGSVGGADPAAAPAPWPEATVAAVATPTVEWTAPVRSTGQDTVPDTTVGVWSGEIDPCGQCDDPLMHRDIDALVAEVASQLRCPVCRQLSVLDSPAEMAQEMRAVIRERLEAGETPEEVKAYFVSKYGEWILLAPKKKGFNLIVWLLPVVGVLGGAVILGVAFRRWTRAGAAEGDGFVPDEDDFEEDPW